MADNDIKITISEVGPYRVEGGPALYDHEGKRIETPHDRPFSLCRCGHSSNKPFCDGSHNEAEWSPELARGD